MKKHSNITTVSYEHLLLNLKSGGSRSIPLTRARRQEDSVPSLPNYSDPIVEPNFAAHRSPDIRSDKGGAASVPRLGRNVRDDENLMMR